MSEAPSDTIWTTDPKTGFGNYRTMKEIQQQEDYIIETEFHNICEEHNIKIDNNPDSIYSQARYWFFAGVLFSNYNIKIKKI